MVFSDPLFLFAFLPLVIAAYFAIPERRTGLRNGLLLVVSLLFYAQGEHVFVLVMLGSILFNYVLGLWVQEAQSKGTRRLALSIAVTGNLGMLGFFKYAGFVLGSVGTVLRVFELPAPPTFRIHLPVGISFFTFQALSYVIDVHRGRVRAQRRPQDLALFISLFPQLIAGPIVRYGDVAEQLERRTSRTADFAYGVQRFVIGLSKKVLLANPCGRRADTILALPSIELGTPLAWLAMVAYMLQIYADFSGYSDMAIGLGRMFGFRFQENFAYPYISKSITEFWHRWHISLSTWFRDYLYLPLGGNRVSPSVTYRNLVIVFLLCGLWHGASWNFVIWGAFHGAFLVTERLIGAHKLERLGFVSHLYTLVVVLVGWVFFRADTLEQSLSIIRTMFGLHPASGRERPLTMFFDSEIAFVLLCGIIASTPVLPWLSRVRRPTPLLATSALFALLLLSIIKVAAGRYNPFIYFRF